MMKRTGRIARESGGFETAYHHETHARHLIRLGAGDAELLRRDDIPETENLAEGKQLERRPLVADLAADLDVRGTTSETLRLWVGLENGDELVLVLLRLRPIHADDDEVEVHLLDAILRLRFVWHGVDVHRAARELVDVVAFLEILDGVHELGVAFDFLALPKLSGGFPKDLIQSVEVHTLSPFLLRFGNVLLPRFPRGRGYRFSTIPIPLKIAYFICPVKPKQKTSISAVLRPKSYEFND